MALNVLVADKLASSALAELESLGATVRSEPELTADLLPAEIRDAEVLVVRSTKVTSATIEAAGHLSLIVRAGAGVNTIDTDAASRAGVAVANCPGKNTAAVAELTIGLLLACDRRIPSATHDLQSGLWKKKEYGKAPGLHGRRLSIVGFGSIGKAVARAAQGLGMQVQAWSRSLTPEIAEAYQVSFCQTLRDAADADAVSVHLAASADTKGCIDEAFLSRMPEGAIFLNTSRGEIVDQGALATAIARRGIRAALDVFADEPSAGANTFDDTEFAALLSAATPHIGASTDQASEAIAAETVRVIRSYVETGRPVNAVNIRERGETEVTLVVRHFNKVGVLASVLDILKNVGINIEEMENTIFRGGVAATCALKLDRKPDESQLASIRSGEHVIQVMLK